MSDVEVLFLGLDITLVIFSALFGDFKKKHPQKYLQWSAHTWSLYLLDSVFYIPINFFLKIVLLWC